MNVIKAPDRLIYDTEVRKSFTLFLAGSIEMGKATDWQTQMAEGLKDVQGYIFNPRRDSWVASWTKKEGSLIEDPAWEQSIDNPVFVEQVQWELDALENAKYIFMHFEPDTKSPISLLELGLHSACENDGGYHKLLVHCPKGFWRKGNVDITCGKYNVSMVDTIEDAILYYGRLGHSLSKKN